MDEKHDWEQFNFIASIRQRLVRIEAKPAKSPDELWLLGLIARMRQELDQLYPEFYQRRYG